MALNDSMGFSEDWFDAADLLDLLDMMIRRREKVYGEIDVVGEEAVKENYSDVVIVIDAIKAVITHRLQVPRVERAQNEQADMARCR